MRELVIFLLIGWVALGSHSAIHRELPGVADILAGFETPQDSARTKVWWFHGETETTREGITADLEAYKKAGIGGVVYYDQTHAVKESKIKALSPEWWDLLKFASQEATRLGLTFETNISNGFVAGGIWITPELSMQQLVFSDTVVTGGEKLSIQLPEAPKRFGYNGDVAVVAFPYDDALFIDTRTRKAKITSNLASMKVDDAFKNDRVFVILPEQPAGESAIIDMDFGDRFTARNISYSMRGRGKGHTGCMQVPDESETFNGTGFYELPDLGELEVSDDGVDYRYVCALKPVYQTLGGTNRITLSFPAVDARYFRLNFHDWVHEKDKKPELEIEDIVLSAAAMIDSWEDKAVLRPSYITGDLTPDFSSEETISSDEIMDITALVDNNGILNWDAPAGKWKILRFAHRPTGGHTKHGRPEMNGLECDKMSVKAMEFHWNSYVAHIIDSIRSCGGRIDGVVMDSHEAGPQNWTPGFEKDFERMRGYDIIKYLPVMAGYVVDSSTLSSKVLYDFRRCIADLTVERYFGTFRRLCEENDVHNTAQDFGALCYAGDPIMAKGVAQKPQGEFWVHHLNGNYDIKESSSAAHLYDKTVASGEAFTDATYSMAPSQIKWLSDYAYAFGINEFVVCASSHQPWLDRFPGCTGGGRHYALDRCNSYWEYLTPQFDSQARTSYLLRQGLPVVDFCLYLGDNAPIRILSHRIPDIPLGYDFDAATTDAFVNRLSFKDGKLSTAGGMTYSMILLPENVDMPLSALRKLEELVNMGAKVWGSKPAGSLSQAESEELEEYARIANRLWGAGKVTKCGKGYVYSGMTLADAVKTAGIEPDIILPESPKMLYNHRRLADGDIYFLANHDSKPFTGELVFRTDAKTVELWNPVEGVRETMESHVTDDGKIAVTVSMEPSESFLVVFSKNSIPGTTVRRKEKLSEIILDDGWSVCYDPKFGGPGEVQVREFSDWSQNEDDRIKYYSGTAIYRTKVNLSDDERWILKVEPFNGALRIKINGKEAGYIWCAPWCADITDAVIDGENLVELEVANSLINRLIRDSMLSEKDRITYCSTPIVKPTDRLRPSGLKGKVKIEQIRK